MTWQCKWLTSTLRKKELSVLMELTTGLQVDAFKSVLISGIKITKNLNVSPLPTPLASTGGSSEIPSTPFKTTLKNSKKILLKIHLPSSASTCRVVEGRLFLPKHSTRNCTRSSKPRELFVLEIKFKLVLPDWGKHTGQVNTTESSQIL